MKEVRRSDQANEDLVNIWEKISTDNPNAAMRLIFELSSKCDGLADFPFMGRLREDLRAGVRSFGVGNYLIFYRVTPEYIDILRILHGACNLQSIFQSETLESYPDAE